MLPRADVAAGGTATLRGLSLPQALWLPWPQATRDPGCGLTLHPPLGQGPGQRVGQPRPSYPLLAVGTWTAEPSKAWAGLLAGPGQGRGRGRGPARSPCLEVACPLLHIPAIPGAGGRGQSPLGKPAQGHAALGQVCEGVTAGRLHPQILASVFGEESNFPSF